MTSVCSSPTGKVCSFVHFPKNQCYLIFSILIFPFNQLFIFTDARTVLCQIPETPSIAIGVDPRSNAGAKRGQGSDIPKRETMFQATVNKMKSWSGSDNVFKRSATFIRESKKDNSSETTDTEELPKLVRSLSIGPGNSRLWSHKLVVERDENGVKVSGRPSKKPKLA